MAIPNQTPYNIFTANGISTVFPYEFYLLNTFDLTVSINGVVQSSGFTISGIGTVAGGEVTFLTPPGNGSVILLERVVPTYRLTEYQDNGDLLAETVNKDFDRLWMAIQQAFINLGLALTRPLLGGPFDSQGYRIENLGNPTASKDAANKFYVDSAIAAEANQQSLNLKRVVRFPDLYLQEAPRLAEMQGTLLGISGNRVVGIKPISDAWDSEAVQLMLDKKLYPVEMGTNYVPGYPDDLVSITATYSDLRERKIIAPNGEFTTTRWMRNRGAAVNEGVTNFILKGQGPQSTVLNHPASTGVGDMIYMDYLKRSYIGKMSLINDTLGQGGNTSSTTNNGQIWLRYCEDTHVDDIFFSGGDVLTFCLDQCYNIFATNLKVDYQIRFPSGYSKSPLIVGDFSEKCMFIQGYAKSISRNGKIYAGDLADNDQANDTVFAFINLMALPYSVRANGNAAMWQEGQLSVSNARLIGVNLFGNGIGHGISEKALGTDIGVVYRAHQVRGVWNLNKFTSIGGQFFDNIGENTSASPIIKAAIHHDNGVMTSSIGGIFENNIRDFSDYSGGKAIAGSAVQSNGDILTSSFYVPGIGTTAVHHGISNGVMTETASIAISGNKSHAVVINESIAGYIGSFGYSNIDVTTVADFIGITAQAGSYTGAMITQVGYGFINCYHSVFRDYLSVLAYSHGGYVLFDNCVFVNVTFSDTDLSSAKYINCKFSNCINAPDIKGFNISAGSPSRPASFSAEVTLNAGEAYTFPAWTHEGRGVYTVKVGGRREDIPYGEYRTYKKLAVSSGVVDEIIVSSPGDFSVTWPSDGFITIAPRVAGRYLIRVS